MYTTLKDNSDEYYNLIALRSSSRRGTTRYVSLTQDLRRNKLERKILKRLQALRLEPFDEQRYLEYASSSRTYETLTDVYKRLMGFTAKEYREYQVLRSVNPDIRQAARDIQNIQ